MPGQSYGDDTTGPALRVLLVEDSEDDALMIERELRRNHPNLALLRVDCERAFVAALSEHWHLVIADYNLPGYSGLGALAALQGRAQDIPFILVSGHIDEDSAVAAMRSGAHDYVLKQNLARLGPAVTRELREAQVRIDRRRTQEMLRESEARFRGITSNLPGMVFQLVYEQANSALHFTFVGDGASSLFQLAPTALLQDSGALLRLIHPDDRKGFDRSLVASANAITTWNWEGRVLLGVAQEIKWINVRSSPRQFRSGEIQWEGIMSNITRAKESALELMHSQTQLAALSSHLQAVKEQERAAVSREVHDDIGGLLVAIKIDVLWLHERVEAPTLRSKCTGIEDLVNRAIATTQRIARDLRPSMLDLGLAAAIEWQAKEFEERMGIPLDLTLPEVEVKLDPDLSAALFRIFQECLTNITKHAEATEVTVRLDVDADSACLSVTDNGRGVAPADQKKPNSFGLRGMRERARSFGGNIQLTTGWGMGTTVRVSVPRHHAAPKW